MLGLLFSVSLAVVLTPAQGLAEVSTDSLLSQSGGIEWPAYGASPGGGHFSAATQITPDNVTRLKKAWHHRSGDFRAAGKDLDLDRDLDSTQSSMQVTPIVVDRRLYYCTPANRVFALDAATGAELWSYDPAIDMAEEGPLSHCRGVSSWRSGLAGFCEHRILFGTADARLVALDAATGEPCADFGDQGVVDTRKGQAEHAARDHGITSPPAILGDTLITGAMVLDNQSTSVPGGVVRAYDVRSGELKWNWHPLPPGMPSRNADGSWLSGTTNV